MAASHDEFGERIRIARNPGDAHLLNRRNAVAGEFDERCRTNPSKVGSASPERFECWVGVGPTDFDTEIDADLLGQCFK